MGEGALLVETPMRPIAYMLFALTVGVAAAGGVHEAPVPVVVVAEADGVQVDLGDVRLPVAATPSADLRAGLGDLHRGLRDLRAATPGRDGDRVIERHEGRDQRADHRFARTGRHRT